MQKVRFTLSERDALRIRDAVGGVRIVIGGRRTPNPSEGVSITHVREGDEDSSDLVQAANALFAARGIRLHHNYDEYLVVTPRGYPHATVIGAAGLSVSVHDEVVEFSVAVSSQHERQGIARKLVQAVIDTTQEYADELEWDAPVVEAYVVNDVAMPGLLRAFQFAPSGPLGRWARRL